MSSTKRGTDCSLDDSLTNIQWLCELESKTLLDGQQSSASRRNATGDHSSINPYPKPPYSYATLILLAINSTLEKRMTLQDIYKWIEDNFPYYTKCKKAWKNSIRHNLSLHSFFLKAKRPASLPGKGSYWSISPEGKENIIKEVMKYQQPTINQDRGVQPQTKGLRPILPKPSEAMIPSAVSTVMGNSSMQVLTDGSLPGLHGNTIPVVILPTQVYMNMATKLVSQTAVTATMTGMDIQMNQSFVPMITESAPTPREGIIGEPLDGQIRMESVESGSNALIKKPDENLSSKCTQTPLPGQHTITVKLGVGNNGDLLNKKTKLERSLPKDKNTSNDKMFAPQTKKSRPDKSNAQPSNRKPTQLKRSPLRTRPQPTLAAINSQTSDAISPGSIFCRNTPGKLNLMSPGKSIVTPTKDAGNRSSLASLWMSPIASSTLAYNSSSGFTPLNYGYDSGIFTPFRDRELDCAFILSPERVTSSNICSTPHQNGRKSRRLSFSRSDKTELESSWIDRQDSSGFAVF